MTESSVGSTLRRHSGGIEAAMRALLSDAVFSHDIVPSTLINAYRLELRGDKL
jgi:hypothetical protein